MKEIQLESIRITSMKDMYRGDEDFKEAYQVCKEMGDKYHKEFSDFIL